jgi:hypothetical protein
MAVLGNLGLATLVNQFVEERERRDEAQVAALAACDADDIQVTRSESLRAAKSDETWAPLAVRAGALPGQDASRWPVSVYWNFVGMCELAGYEMQSLEASD